MTMKDSNIMSIHSRFEELEEVMSDINMSYEREDWRQIYIHLDELIDIAHELRVIISDIETEA